MINEKWDKMSISDYLKFTQKWISACDNVLKNGANKQMRDVWELSLVQGIERIKGSDKKAAHPTQKPEEIQQNGRRNFQV
jgi:DNA modification methylase